MKFASKAQMLEWPRRGATLTNSSLKGRAILITGAARRIGRELALASAEAGADVVLHYHHSGTEAEAVRRRILELGRRAWILQADLSLPAQAMDLAEKAFELCAVDGLVNSAALFAGGTLPETTVEDWDLHMAVNLRAPFLLAQAFGRLLGNERTGRIVNMLDWRATRPGSDHLAYTVSKAALAAMTRSLAQALAPNVSVNGIALGAFLPPEGSAEDAGIVRKIPAGRWGTPEEAGRAVVFLLGGPAYITGEILYLDGGRHLI